MAMTSVRGVTACGACWVSSPDSHSNTGTDHRADHNACAYGSAYGSAERSGYRYPGSKQ